MPVWRTRPIDEQPSLTLRQWRVVELPDGDRHLVGHCIENNEGRVSSVICHFDPSSLRAITGTGRVYMLSGGPGIDMDAEYVWSRWAGMNSVSTWTDVSDQVLDEHLAVRKSRPSAIQPRARPLRDSRRTPKS